MAPCCPSLHPGDSWAGICLSSLAGGWAALGVSPQREGGAAGSEGPPGGGLLWLSREWARPAPPCLHLESPGTYCTMTQISSPCPVKPEGCQWLLWVNTPTVNLSYLIILFCDFQPARRRGGSLRSWWHMCLWVLGWVFVIAVVSMGPRVTCTATGCTLRSAILERDPRENPRRGQWAPVREEWWQSEEPSCCTPPARRPHASRCLHGFHLKKATGSPWEAVKAMCPGGAQRFPGESKFIDQGHWGFLESSEFWSGSLLTMPQIICSRFCEIHGLEALGWLVCWESTAIQQVLRHLVTWTRKKSGARLQFCFIQVNGFNPTTMKTVGFLCQGCSISRMQTSRMTSDVDLLRSMA